MAQTTATTPAISWGKAVFAGIIGGVVFMMLEMLLVGTVGGGSAWGPPRMIAAIGMGQGVLPPPATFSAGIFIVAMIIHFALSIVYAVILAFFIGRLSKNVALVGGAVFGLVLYLINFYGFTAVFPWFAMARGPITIITHIIFGLVAAWAYRGLAKSYVAAS